jgi:sulfur-carrier protein
MSVLVRIPTPLRAVTQGQGEVTLEAASVTDLITKLEQQFTGMKGRLRDEEGGLLHFVNIYVNDEDIRFLAGPETALKAGDQVSIVPAMAGGR